ncbi:ATP-binding protein [Parabacteroides sp. GYB001]|uniref:ATP-binding protein n=2 Tax=Parabacteroides leei TaxID=2939491 RepID=UPI002016F80B|nr:ATP-binding protein [Parabacteroides leei]MCL3852081.1 ATP-binding protein [Parabacteroides leei]
MAKKIPYGLTDYVLLMTDNYYYVDKTQYISLLEQTARYLFLIRPRRFGKSLFLNMLHCYYDVKYADRFDELFGNQYIGKHPTGEQGKYLVLYFNFSAVRGLGEDLEKNFNSYAKIQMEGFADQYASYFEPGFPKEIRELETAASQLNFIGKRAAMSGLSIYLLIDEYDNFTNTILSSEGNNVYRALTHDSGFYRGFFNIVKSITTGPEAPVKRMFITGVSPVTLDDVTSGFNIGTNITTNRKFNGMVGFSESELYEMLSYYNAEGMLPDPIDEVTRMMKPWYDNYCFAKECIGQTMYNSDMVLYFLNNYLLDGHVPSDMLDRNIRTDYSKLRHFIRIDKMQEEGCSVITRLIDTGEVNGNAIKSSFPAENLADPGNFISLLYYFGLLTYDRVEYGETIMKVPNLAVREQIYGYLVEAMKERESVVFPFMEFSDRMRRMAYFGEWEAALAFFAEQVDKKAVLRDAIYQETTIKTLMVAYMGLTDYFIIWPEFEAGRGFSDLYLMPNLANYPDMKYSYLIELKFLKRDDTTTKVDSLIEEAETQLRKYASDEKVLASSGNTRLRLLAAVYKGWQPVAMREFE